MGCEACPEMTVKQRLIAVVACCALGYCIEAFSTLTLLSGKRSFATFATMYVFGNVLAILATCFWVGPKRMCSRMWKSTRRIATSVYLSTLLLVFVLALLGTPVGIMMVLVCMQARERARRARRRTRFPPTPRDDPRRDAPPLQVCAGVWYSASFLPKGRWLILQCCKMSLFSPCPEVLDPLQKSLPMV